MTKNKLFYYAGPVAGLVASVDAAAAEAEAKDCADFGMTKIDWMEKDYEMRRQEWRKKNLCPNCHHDDVKKLNDKIVHCHNCSCDF